jgi:hypothetical protein
LHINEIVGRYAGRNPVPVYGEVEEERGFYANVVCNG